jgi:hypothetical protein
MSESNDPMTDIVIQLQELNSALSSSLNTMRDALSICLNSIMVDIAALKESMDRDKETPD